MRHRLLRAVGEASSIGRFGRITAICCSARRITFLLFGTGKVALIDYAYPRASAEMGGRTEGAFVRRRSPLSIDVAARNHIELDHSGARSQWE
jgi:hypothetical protein